MNLIPAPIATAVIVALIFAALMILCGLVFDKPLDQAQDKSDDEKDRRIVAERIARADERDIAQRRRMKAYPLTTNNTR